MKPRRLSMIVGLAALALVGCGDSGGPTVVGAERDTGPEMGRLQGEAYYRERIALPPGAELTVVLEDVSRMDVPATVLAEYRVGVDSPPPYAFELTYDPAAIEERMRYNVRAKITLDGRLRFISQESNDPFKRPDGETLRVLMSPVDRAEGPR